MFISVLQERSDGSSGKERNRSLSSSIIFSYLIAGDDRCSHPGIQVYLAGKKAIITNYSKLLFGVLKYISSALYGSRLINCRQWVPGLEYAQRVSPPTMQGLYRYVRVVAVDAWVTTDRINRIYTTCYIEVPYKTWPQFLGCPSKNLPPICLCFSFLLKHNLRWHLKKVHKPRRNYLSDDY